jgi:NADPH:quinone reductase
MADTATRAGLQLRSTVKKEGIVEISIAEVPTQEPKPDEVVVRIEASPINPSDQGLLFAGADLSTARRAGTADRPIVTATVTPAVMKSVAGRLEQSLPVGNEGAGVSCRPAPRPRRRR